MFSKLLESRNYLGTTVATKISDDDSYIRVDVFEDRVVRTSHIRHLDRTQLPLLLDAIQEVPFTFQFKQNQNGEPYLICLDAKGTDFSWGFIADIIHKDNDLSLFIKEQVIALYNRVSDTSFDMITTNTTANNIADFAFLCFPLFRHEIPVTNPNRLMTRSSQIPNRKVINTPTMTMISKAYLYCRGTMCSALREAQTMDDFCDMIYPKSSLKTPQDYELGKQVSLFWAVSAWNLNLTISEQVLYESALRKALGYSGDMFKFLFDWLPERDGRRLLDHLFVAADDDSDFLFSQKQFEASQAQILKKFKAHQLETLDLTELEKKELASLMFDFIVRKNIRSFQHTNLLPLWYEVAQWYASNVKTRLLSSSRYTPNDIKKVWASTFGLMSGKDECVLFEDPHSLGVASLGSLVEDDDEDYTDLWAYLLPWFIPSKNSHLNSLVIADPSTGELAETNYVYLSYDEFMGKLLSVTAQIDNALQSYQVDATPTNRIAYLMLDEKRRMDMRAWKMLSWGIDDINRIKALLALKEDSLEQLHKYSQLPDDIFYELLFDCTPPIPLNISNKILSES